MTNEELSDQITDLYGQIVNLRNEQHRTNDTLKAVLTVVEMVKDQVEPTMNALLKSPVLRMLGINTKGL